ncbi:hypothetical protein [Natrarchaeobius halalkaliphilus]|uniref:hypothetical protein n=1 Tax=Natrarchaeobius halalkaliphilus TaxID=1679091 RepID=UPI000F5202F0|nr:hypothetical protein [Natrarchaeobius halalkaliphilus]
MRIEPYNHGVQEHPLRHPADIVRHHYDYGYKETSILLFDNLNERGVRAAGKRFLPLYGVGGYFVLLVLTIAVGGVQGAVTVVDRIAPSILRLILVCLWFCTPLLIYWDCQAAERYLRQDWSGGKLNALLGIFVGPGALFLQVLYRIRKLRS